MCDHYQDRDAPTPEEKARADSSREKRNAAARARVIALVNHWINEQAKLDPHTTTALHLTAKHDGSGVVVIDVLHTRDTECARQQIEG